MRLVPVKTDLDKDDIAPILAGDVTCYWLDDEAILFSQNDQQLFRLNPTAALIWCRCEEGWTPRAIARSLAQVYAISSEAAFQGVVAALAEWRRLGLVASGETDAPVSRPPQDSASLYPEVSSSSSVTHAARFYGEHRYRLLDLCCRVRFVNSQSAGLVQPILAHLEVPGDRAYHVSLDIVREEQGYILLHDGKPVFRCAVPQELGPLVHTEILLTAYARTEALLAIHAAALARDGYCVLFPAASGSGKSTLAAALMAASFIHLTDELALVTHRPHTIRPVPVSLSLKPGAWPVLGRLYPDLQELPVHLRQDGKLVRYLTPSREKLPPHPDDSYPVHCIVFPRYQKGAPATLTRLSAAEALCRLTAAGYDVNGRLDSADVAELVSWIGGLDCYEMCFDRLSEVQSRIKALLA